MGNGFIKQFILSKRGLGLSRDDIYRLALLSFGTEWENLILMVLCEVEKEYGANGPSPHDNG